MSIEPDYLASALGVIERCIESGDSVDSVVSTIESCFPNLDNPRSHVEKVAQEIARKEEFLSAALRERVAAERNHLPAPLKLRWRSAADFEEAAEAIDWVIRGYVARGAITDMSGKPKAAGKTTWTAEAVKSILAGVEFMGRATSRERIVWLTEERMATFSQSLRRAGLLDADPEDLSILCRHDCGAASWPEIVATAVDRASETDAGVLVVDTGASFMGLKSSEENDSGAVMAAMRPLHAAAAEGLAVLLNRHDRKSGGEVGEAGRGSNAWTGAVDIVLGLQRPPGGNSGAVRELHGISRFDETPGKLVIELTPEGYVAHGDGSNVAHQKAVEALLAAAPTSEGDALTTDALLEAAGVKRTIAQGALKELEEEDKLAKIGAGKRGDPFRFFLPQPSSLGRQKEYEAETPHVDDESACAYCGSDSCEGCETNVEEFEL